MRDRVYGVYDRVAELVLGGLMQLPGDPAAIRQFVDLIRDSQNPIGKHPHDFELRCFGEMSSGDRDDRGELLPPVMAGYGESQVIVTGAAVVAADGAASELPRAKADPR